MKRILCVAAVLMLAACSEKDLTAPARLMPQRDHTSSTYPSDPSIGAMSPAALTTWSGVDRSPTWSPDGSRIAFASNRFTNVPTSIASSIYVMDASGDGSGLRRVTTGTVDQQPTWSPDGGTIAFVRNGGLYKVAATGGFVTALIPQNSGVSDPRYSPDGTRIAFTKAGQVQVISAFGGGATQVTPSDGAQHVYPEWLDANTLIFTRLSATDESVWKMTVGDATSATQLTPSETGMFRYADITSDASVLVFTTASNLVFQDMSTSIHTVGRTSVTPTADAAAANVEFSPDGTKVIFVGIGALGSSDIFVADVPQLRAGDMIPPTIAFAGGLEYTLDQQVSITCTATDEQSGVATTSCPDVASGPAYLFDTTNVRVATATDNAGNIATDTVVFTVHPTLQGLTTVVSQMVQQDGVANSLNAKLRAAANAKQPNAKQQQVDAFMLELSALVGGRLTQEQAEILAKWAQLL